MLSLFHQLIKVEFRMNVYTMLLRQATDDYTFDADVISISTSNSWVCNTWARPRVRWQTEEFAVRRLCTRKFLQLNYADPVRLQTSRISRPNQTPSLSRLLDPYSLKWSWKVFEMLDLHYDAYNNCCMTLNRLCLNLECACAYVRRSTGWDENKDLVVLIC